MKNKFFNIILIISMMMTFSTIVVNAEEKEYLVWVNNIQITDSNKNDVLGNLDGDKATVKFTPASGDKKAKLTLNGATIYNGHYDQSRAKYSAIQSEYDMIIEIKGKNFLGKYDGEEQGINRDSSKYSVDYGILDELKNLNFIGDGSLTIEDRTDGIYARNVTFDENFGSLTINDYGSIPMPPCAISVSTLIINGGSFYINSILAKGISANKVIINNGFIKIKNESDENAIDTMDSIIINDNLEVINAEYIKGTTTILKATDVNVDNGFVTISKKYSYDFIKGINQKFNVGNIKSYVLEIDGDYTLFQSLKIGNLNLIKDVDYIVSEGSTVITFTEKGLVKLNSLVKGDYEVLINYSNNKEVKGKLIINDSVEVNPNTKDNLILYFVFSLVSIAGLRVCRYILNKKILN